MAKLTRYLILGPVFRLCYNFTDTQLQYEIFYQTSHNILSKNSQVPAKILPGM